MKDDDRKLLSSVIEQNAQRVTVEELARRGNRHVRVISGTKTLELIEAIVDRTIARRAGELADADRDRIVQEAEQQFRQVSRIQAEAEGLIGQQKAHIQQLQREIQAERAKQKELVLALRRREKRLSNARRTIDSYDGEIERLARQVREDASLIERLKGEIEQRQAQLPGLVEGAVEKILARLSEREASSGTALEDRFRASLDESLDKIRKTLHSATARAVDRPVEATDVLVSKVFDDEDSMDTNLGRLDVHVSTMREGITSSLDRLRRMREEALAPDEDSDSAEATT